MKRRLWLATAAGVLAIAAAVVTAHAAPIARIATDFKAVSGETSNVEKAAHRRCGQRHGQHRRHCRYYGDPYYPFGRYGYAYGFSFFDYTPPPEFYADRPIRRYRR